MRWATEVGWPASKMDPSAFGQANSQRQIGHRIFDIMHSIEHFLALKFYKLLAVAGILLFTSSCAVNPLRKHAGTYCIDLDKSGVVWGCFYLKENGRGSMDSFMGSANIEWELLSKNRIKIVNAFTGNGMSLILSNDGSKLIYRHILGAVDYSKQ